MRIALAHPTYWPEVRRGSERVVHDLAVSLASRGHEVSILTSHRGTRSIATEGGVLVVRRHRPPAPRVARRYEDLIESAPGLAWELRRREFDLVHAFFPVDGWIASVLRRARRLPPFVFSFHGIPTRRYLVARRYRLEMLAGTAATAAATSVLSASAAEPFRRYLLRSPLVLNPGVLMGRFSVDVDRFPEPTLLCTASLRDPRKRASLLLEAFASVREQVPSARLLLDTPRDPVMGTLAAPALPEVGRLFEPDNAASLAGAMLEALELAGQLGTVSACRERARAYDWTTVVERYERVYVAARG